MTKHIHYLKGRSQFMEFFHFNKFGSDNIFLPRKVKDEEYVKMPVEFDSEQDNEDIFRIAQDVRAGKLPMEHFIKHTVKLNDRLEKIWGKAK